MSTLDPERLEVASLSDVGRVRASNQDACAEPRTADGARLLVVADGMGGHAGGETASRLAVETVCARMAEASGPAGAALGRAFADANRVVHDTAQRETALAGMGTTCVAACFTRDGRVHVANVGDSRAYLLRDGRLEQITADHSLVAELQRRGMLSAEEALVHPRRNEVLRSLGIEAEVQVDLRELELRAGDVVLLCSDGLTGPVRDPEIAALLGGLPPADAARALVARANERGGPDNVTVQIARVPADGGAAAGRPRARGASWRWIVAAVGALLLLALWRITA